MSNRKVIIIGGGTAGLITGSYLQMNGYSTEIFEMNSRPGGLCTSWKKDGFTFDGCIHWLVGSSPAVPSMYACWNELIDMKKLKFIDHDIYMRVEDENRNYIDVFSDINRFERELITKAPEDAALTIPYCNTVRKFTKLKMDVSKPREVSTPIDGLKMIKKFLPYMKDLNKWLKISEAEFAKKCKNPIVKRIFEYAFVPEMALIFMIFTQAWMHNKSAGYPIGGSLHFAELLEKRYTSLGGKINYNKKAEKIITENAGKLDRATGVVLKDGSEHHADYIVSAADGHATIFKMLEGKYADKEIKGYYENLLTFSSFLQVSLGLGAIYHDIPNAVMFPLNKPFDVDPETSYDILYLRNHCFDPTLAPEGKSVFSYMIPTYNHTYWEELRKKDRAKYLHEKERISNFVIQATEERFGGIAGKVEQVDVSTPATVIRYTNNWKGSFEGWMLTPQVGFKSLRKTLPGLENFYMVGQWVTPGGGLPSSLTGGRGIARILCKKDRKKFQTESFG